MSVWHVVTFAIGSFCGTFLYSYLSDLRKDRKASKAGIVDVSTSADLARGYRRFAVPLELCDRELHEWQSRQSTTSS